MARFSCFILVASAASQLAPACLADAKKNAPFACKIKSKSVYRLGDVPRIDVSITNLRKTAIYLVGSLDGSETKDRYPHCYFLILGPDGKPVGKPKSRICGSMNLLEIRDFVRIPPAKSFDPLKFVEEDPLDPQQGPTFYPSTQINQKTFGVPGMYRVRFVYSTNEADSKHWTGETLVDSPLRRKLEKLLSSVPRATAVSNEISIKITHR